MRTREKQMRTIRQLVALIALAMLAIGACAGAAAATPQRFGAQSLPDTVTGSGFVGAGSTFVPTAAATASTQPVGSPINGVLTLIESRYSMAAPAARPFGYRILTNTGGLNFTARPATISGTAQNRTVTPPPSPAVAADAVVFADAAGHPRGINIAAGERLGVFAGPNMIFNFSAGGATVAAVSGDHTTGSQLYAPAFGGL